MCLIAGMAGDQCLPVCPFLHGLPGAEMVLHQGPAWGECDLQTFTQHANVLVSTLFYMEYKVVCAELMLHLQSSMYQNHYQSFIFKLLKEEK